MENSKPSNLRLEALRVLVGELSDDDKSSLLEVLYAPKNEPDLNLWDFGDLEVKNLTVKDILRILSDIDSKQRTDFSARIYFTGSEHFDNHIFETKTGYKELGVIANCKLVGMALLRLVRYFHEYPDEEDIEEILEDDKEQFYRLAHQFIDGAIVRNFINFLTFFAIGSDEVITSTFETEIYSRSKGTNVYETDISKVDVWTLARLYSKLYEEQLYERKIIRNIPDT